MRYNNTNRTDKNMPKIAQKNIGYNIPHAILTVFEGNGGQSPHIIVVNNQWGILMGENASSNTSKYNKEEQFEEYP